MPQSAVAELTYNRLPKHPLIPSLSQGQLTALASYKEDMLFLIFYGVFIEGKTLRTQQAFEETIKENKPKLLSIVNEVGQLALDIMKEYGAIKKVLEKNFKSNDTLVIDINQQLDFLIYVGFIRHTPYQFLKAIPRYLKAIQYRIDKYDNNSQKCQDINRYSVWFWTEIESRSKKELTIPEKNFYRWALEEFRVSLFAQQLKTAYPISTIRMMKLWDEHRLLL